MSHDPQEATVECTLELRMRNLTFFTCPEIWSCRPFLPLVRRRPGQEEELGVLCDLLGVRGLPGHSATVWFTNLFLLPDRWEDFLALPREVHDTPEEIFDAGWRVD